MGQKEETTMSAVDFKKLLSREALDRMAFMDENYRGRRDDLRKLTDKNLAATVKLYVANMQMPYKYKEYRACYDTAFFYVVLPELLRRLRMLTPELTDALWVEKEETK
jgi:hypothetical protein